MGATGVANGFMYEARVRVDVRQGGGFRSAEACRVIEQVICCEDKLYGYVVFWSAIRRLPSICFVLFSVLFFCLILCFILLVARFVLTLASYFFQQSPLISVYFLYFCLCSSLVLVYFSVRQLACSPMKSSTSTPPPGATSHAAATRGLQADGGGAATQGGGGESPQSEEDEPPRRQRTLKRQLTKHVVTRWYRAPELILLQVRGEIMYVFPTPAPISRPRSPPSPFHVPILPFRSPCLPFSLSSLPAHPRNRTDMKIGVFFIFGVHVCALKTLVLTLAAAAAVAAAAVPFEVYKCTLVIRANYLEFK